MAEARREIRKTISPFQLCGAHRSKCGRGTTSGKNRAKREAFRAPCLAPNPANGRDRLGCPLGFDATDAVTHVTRIWRVSQQPHLLNRNHNHNRNHDLRVAAAACYGRRPPVTGTTGSKTRAERRGNQVFRLDANGVAQNKPTTMGPLGFAPQAIRYRRVAAKCRRRNV